MIVKHIKVLTTDPSQLEIQGIQSPNLTLCIGTATGLFMIIYLGQILAYVFVEETFTPDPNWIARIYSKCSNVQEDESYILNDFSAIISCLTAPIYSAYLGLLSHRRLHGPEWTGMFKTSLKITLLRFVVLALLCLPFGLVLLFTIKTKMPIPALVVIEGSMTLCLGFMLFGVSQLVFKRLKLLNGETECNKSYNKEHGYELMNANI